MGIKGSIFRGVKNTILLRYLFLVPFYMFRFVYFSLRENSMLFFRYYPGYHGSTLPSYRYIRKENKRLFPKNIDYFDAVWMNEEEQKTLLERFIELYGDFSPSGTKSQENLYYYKNDMFGFNDAFYLSCFLKEYKPKRVIEIGSGFSSALMLDTDKEVALNSEFTFIDPYSKNIDDVLQSNPNGSYKLIRKEIQDVDLSAFSALEENDILFIDSSHVVKIGSDLSTILFKIIPALKKGVIVHFHDVWYPWEYPSSMLDDGRSYNEIYFIRAFLQYNSAFKVMLFGSYLEYRYKNLIESAMPNLLSRCTGKSLWIQKVS